MAATPVAFVPRSNLLAWRADKRPEAASLGGHAASALAALERRGAMFTADLEMESGLLPQNLEQAIGELISKGLVTADAFSPLRWLIRPEAEKRRQQKRLSRARRSFGPSLLGRWSVPSFPAEAEEGVLFRDQARLATVCEALLRRYGVVFRAVLERENLAPPWRFLLRYLRRMEDRGEVLGGRFVDGFSGEQFALPEAVGLLRNLHKEGSSRQLNTINAADPLNLGGIITPGVKTPVRTSNRILLLNGVPAARIMGDELELLKGGEKVSSAEAERYLRVIRPFATKVRG